MINPERKLGTARYVEAVYFGAWRQMGDGERADPDHVLTINGVRHVPASLYGPKPKEAPINLNTSNNHLPTT